MVCSTSNFSNLSNWTHFKFTETWHKIRKFLAEFEIFYAMKTVMIWWIYFWHFFDDEHKGNFDIQEYTCQISAYTPTDLKHSVKIRGESEYEFDQMMMMNWVNKGVSRFSWTTKIKQDSRMMKIFTWNLVVRRRHL